MAKDNYLVVFSGKASPETGQEKAAQNLARILGRKTESVRGLFNEKPIVVKKTKDKKTAQAYARAMQREGLTCEVRPPKNREDKSLETKAPSVSDPCHNNQRSFLVAPIKPTSADPLFSPKSCPKLNGTKNGFILHRQDSSVLPYSDISICSVFKDPKDPKKGTSFLLFSHKEKRPFHVDAAAISFSDFPDVTGQMMLVSLRNLITHLVKTNPDIILDEMTFGFLQGGPPVQVKDMAAHVTSLGHAILPGDKTEVSQKTISSVTEKPQKTHIPAPKHHHKQTTPKKPAQTGQLSPTGRQPSKKASKQASLVPAPIAKNSEGMLKHREDAPLQRRVLSALCDALFVGSIVVPFLIPLDIYFKFKYGAGIAESEAARMANGETIVWLAIVTLLAMSHVLVFSAEKVGQTWGQRLTGLLVIGSDGRVATGPGAWLMRFVGLLLQVVTLCLTTVLTRFAPEKASLSDSLSGTRQIEVESLPPLTRQLIAPVCFSAMWILTSFIRAYLASAPKDAIIMAGGSFAAPAFYLLWYLRQKTAA